MLGSIEAMVHPLSSSSPGFGIWVQQTQRGSSDLLRHFQVSWEQKCLRGSGSVVGLLEVYRWNSTVSGGISRYGVVAGLPKYPRKFVSFKGLKNISYGKH